MDALCALAPATAVDLVQLQDIWNELDAEWVRRFWENDNGNRNVWINRIAAAPAADKQTIRDIMAEQIRFGELYNDPAGIRVSQRDWGNPVLKALKELLKSFYVPYFYSHEGYGAPNGAAGGNFHKDIFIRGFPNGGPTVCPYCDNNARKLELDHFLPKDEFPVLSCHPDNLIPSCHDCNSITQKGTKVPLSMTDADQAADWFHPRRRSAWQKLRVLFREDTEHQLQTRLEPVHAADARRAEKLDWLFSLAAFWGRTVYPDIQEVSGVVSVLLQEEPRPLSEDTVRRKLLAQAAVFRKMIGSWGLAIPQSSLYEFVAGNEALVKDVLRTCNEDAPLPGQAAQHVP